MYLRTFGALLALSSTAGLLAQTQVDLRSQTKQVDFSAAPATRPVKTGTTAPATCATGDLFFRTTATPGQNLFGCVAANTWIQLSGGASGGSGSGSATPWNDLAVVRVSGTLLMIGSACTTAAPCNIRFGNVVTVIASPITVTIGAGTGTGLARIYVTDSGVVLVDHSLSAGVTLTCTAGCSTQQSVVPVYPANSIPLGEVLITAGAWSTVTDMRALLHSRALTAGQGISITEAAGVATVEIDTGDVPRLGGNNDWTGSNDFGAASMFRMRNGAGVPATGECNAAAHAGRLYVRNDTGASNASFYVCAKTGASAYSWELLGGGGTGGGSSTIDCMSEGAVCLKDDFPYTGSGTGGYSELSWRTNGNPAYAAWFNSGTRVGVLRFITGGANAVNSIYQDAGGANVGFLNLSQLATFELVFIWQPATLTANYQFAVGVSSDGTMNGPGGAMFRLANSTGCTTNFAEGAVLHYITRDSGAATATSSGITVSAGQWLKTRVRKLSGETQLRFAVSVNGAAYSAETTVSTNLPSTSLQPFFQVTSCDGNDQVLYLDYFRFSATGVAR